MPSWIESWEGIFISSPGPIPKFKIKGGQLCGLVLFSSTKFGISQMDKWVIVCKYNMEL